MNPDTCIREAMKPYSFNYYQYSSICIYDSMMISSSPNNLVTDLNYTCVIPDNSVKGLLNDKVRYLGETIIVFNVNKPFGGVHELY